MFKKHGKDNKDKNEKHHEHLHGHSKPDAMGGELDVTLADEVHIELPRKPKDIFALFSRDCNVTPCNPRHFDSLKVYVCQFHKHYCLVISWNVSNTRKIIWEAKF